MAVYDATQFEDENGNIYNYRDDTSRQTANEASSMAAATRQTANGIGSSVANNVWKGRNLATLYASAIGSTDPITWLKNIASGGRFNDYDIQIGDYLPCTLNNTAHTVMNFMIAAFDQYYGVGDTANGHHITLVPEIVYPENILFNETANNNGTAEETTPWRASNLYKWCNETFYEYLPSAWKSALKDIRVYQPIRYSASSSALTDDNGGAWINLGKVWVPSEIEVWGSVRRGSQMNGTTAIACTDKQLPIFANGRSVIRSRTTWWERCAAAGSASNVCYVTINGLGGAASATSSGVRPLPCFHIG